MKQFSIFHVPVLSFFSKSLYRDVCYQWKGTCFAYLLLLLAVCMIPPIVKMDKALTESVDKESPKIVSQVPDFSIVNGKASINEAQPYYIQDPETGAPFIIIDTTGTITSLAETQAWGLVSETEAIFKKSEFETRTFSFQNVDHFYLDEAKINGWLSFIKKFAVPVIYPLAVLGSFVVRIIQALLYGAIGLLFASWCKSERTYNETLRLSVIALTPCIIIKALIGIAQINVPFAGLWYFLIAMGYLFFGIKAAVISDSPTTKYNQSQGGARVPD